VADRIIENPIINSPYREPDRHFRFDDDSITNEIVPGRRPSQYFIPVPRPRKRGQQIELEFAEFTADKIRTNDFVNQVRDRVDIWRKQGTHTSHLPPAACSSTGPTRSGTTRSCSHSGKPPRR
jgi:type III restriction enzyme